MVVGPANQVGQRNKRYLIFIDFIFYKLMIFIKFDSFKKKKIVNFHIFFILKHF